MARFYRRRRFYRKKRFIPRAFKYYVNKSIHRNIENKFYTGSLVTVWSSVANAWIEQDLCYPAQGDGISARTGSSIKIRSIEIKGVIAQGSNESAVDDSYNIMRIVIARYNGGNLTTPLATAAASMNTPITNEFYTNGVMRQKYLDKYIPLNVQSTEQGEGDGYCPQVKSFKYYKKFKKPVTIRFGDSGTTNVTQRIMMACISDSAAIVNPGFVAGYWKVMFEDA